MDDVLTDPPSFALPRPKGWVIAILVVLFFLILAIFLARAPLLNFLETTVQREARSRGVIVQVEKSSLAMGGGYLAKAVNLTYPKAFLGLRITDLSLSPLYGEFILGRAGGIIHASIYGGTCNSKIASPNWQFRDLSGSINCGEIALATHPLFMGMGISKGTLFLNVNEAKFKSGELRHIVGDISLKEVSLPRGFSIALPNQFSVSIPPVTNFTLEAKVTSDGETLSLTDGTYSSSLGHGEVRASLSMAKRGDRAEHLLVEGELNLTPQGKEHLSPFLLLFGRGKVKSSNVKFRVSGGFKNPLVIVEDK